MLLKKRSQSKPCVCRGQACSSVEDIPLKHSNSCINPTASPQPAREDRTFSAPTQEHSFCGCIHRRFPKPSPFLICSVMLCEEGCAVKLFLVQPGQIKPDCLFVLVSNCLSGRSCVWLSHSLEALKRRVSHSPDVSMMIGTALCRSQWGFFDMYHSWAGGVTGFPI